MNKYQEYIDLIASKIQELNQANEDYLQQLDTIANARNELDELQNKFSDLVKTKSEGFPILAEAYSEYFDYKYSQIEELLRHKQRPALKTADEIKLIRKEVRGTNRHLKEMEYIVKYYEQMFPSLVEIRGEDHAITELLDNPEDTDPVQHWLEGDEYKKLGTIERNQLALDRWWKKWKDKKGIGTLFEMYVGYMFEELGYDVEYTGIKSGVEDLGRDLIATRGKDMYVVQCKFWSINKTIHEKHIFQLFGSKYECQLANPSKNVLPAFFTSTVLSTKARTFAKELEIIIREEVKMPRFPIIKCNVNIQNNSKIYHLPFDQQYYRTVLKKEEGDFMAGTVAEAEQQGFRRAYRHKYNH